MDITKGFNEILDKSGNNENEIQKYLEENLELVPLPFLLNHGLHLKAILKKLKLPNDQITDFTYLTKSSVEWNVVHIELEGSNKKIFTQSKKRTVFTAEFNNAYDQITNWKSYLDQNGEAFRNRERLMLLPLPNNKIIFKYVLIIGRNKEISNQEKINMFQQKNSPNIKVMTYDSLLNYFKENESVKKILVSKSTNNTYNLLNLNRVDTSLLVHMGKDNLIFNDSVREELLEEGYDIDSWEAGEALVVNNKQTFKAFKDSLQAKKE